MRRTWVLAALLFSEAAAADLASDVAREQRFRSTAMVTLGGWAIGNIAVGLPMTGAVTTATERGFWQMNVYWNLVNVAIAGYGLWSARRLDRTMTTARDLEREQRSLEQFLWLNVGLDVAYLLAGWAFLERGARQSAPESAARWTGFGRSLLVQGAFLLLFDGTLLALAPTTAEHVSLSVLPQQNGASALLRWRL